MYQPFNAYQNPIYNAMFQAQTPSFNNAGPQGQNVHIVHVNGKQGAEAIVLPPNSDQLVWDDTKSRVWLITTDGAGYATRKPLTLSEEVEEKPVDIGSLESRIKKLEDAIYDRKPTEQTVPEHKSGRKSNRDTADDEQS